MAIFEYLVYIFVVISKPSSLKMSKFQESHLYARNNNTYIKG